MRSRGYLVARKGGSDYKIFGKIFSGGRSGWGARNHKTLRADGVPKYLQGAGVHASRLRYVVDDYATITCIVGSRAKG